MFQSRRAWSCTAQCTPHEQAIRCRGRFCIYLWAVAAGFGHGTGSRRSARASFWSGLRSRSPRERLHSRFGKLAPEVLWFQARGTWVARGAAARLSSGEPVRCTPVPRSAAGAGSRAPLLSLLAMFSPIFTGSAVARGGFSRGGFWIWLKTGRFRRLGGPRGPPRPRKRLSQIQNRPLLSPQRHVGLERCPGKDKIVVRGV